MGLGISLHAIEKAPELTPDIERQIIAVFEYNDLDKALQHQGLQGKYGLHERSQLADAVKLIVANAPPSILRSEIIRRLLRLIRSPQNRAGR